MSNILIVREYDTIIKNAEYKDSPYYKYLPEKYFEELIQFVKEYTPDEDDSDALEFLKIGYKKGVKDVISVNNYVGLIELPSGYQIEILPKIELKSLETESDRTKKVFLKMLQALKNFEGKSFKNAALKSDRMNLYEIFINMYIGEVQTLVKHGLKSSYNAVENNLSFYKGRLNVSQHIKNNIVHKNKFFVGYDEYSIDRAENRLIKTTLLKLLKISTSDENIREIRKLLPSFELVSESFNYSKDFSSVVLDRNTKDYETLMIWSRIFLENKSFTTFSGETSGKALLFPMEKVFEEYVAKWVRKIFSEFDWTVKTQDKGYHLFDYPRRFALRPDIVVKKDGSTVIMDTKWKRLSPGQNNYGISQADMYQMYVYAKKYHSSEIWLLYPLNSSFTGEEEISFKAEVNEDLPVNVHISFIDLDNIQENVYSLYQSVITGEQQ